MRGKEACQPSVGAARHRILVDGALALDDDAPHFEASGATIGVRGIERDPAHAGSLGEANERARIGREREAGLGRIDRHHEPIHAVVDGRGRNVVEIDPIRAQRFLKRGVMDLGQRRHAGRWGAERSKASFALLDLH